MRIAVLPPRGVAFPEDSSWNALIVGLRSAGHEVHGYGDVAGVADAVVALNDQPLAAKIQRRDSIPPSRSVLVVLEPRVTAPKMYSASTLRRYGARFAASPMWARSMGAESILWPQNLEPIPVSSGRSFQVSMINAEKRSAVAGSLYGLRRTAVLECDARGVPLAVFGAGWGQSRMDRAKAGLKASLKAINAGLIPSEREALGHLGIRPRNWQGPVPDKGSAFSAAPATLIIENSADYVSEKLIDAIRAGVAPIYVGPPLGAFSIPDNVAMSCNPDPRDIVRTLMLARPKQIEAVISAGQEWLGSGDAAAHDIQRVLADVGHRIGAALHR